MGIRWYDPALGRWIQADSIVPEPGNPQAWNRFSYVYNNPLRYTDPSGHQPPPEPPVPVDPGFWQGLMTLRALLDRDWGYDPGESYRQAVGLGIDWFLNKEPRVREFGPESSLTLDIMNDPGMTEFRQKWAEAGYPLPFKWEHHRDERAEGTDFEFDKFVKAIPPYFKEHVVKMALVSVGIRSQTREGQLDPLGGTIGSLDEIRVYDAGNGMVTIEVYNRMNWVSLIRTPGHSWAIVEWKIPGTGRTLDYFLRYIGGSADHEQYFRWQEPMPTMYH
jgi:hypothetical protein